MHHYTSLVAVAVGGAVGSLARWAVLEIAIGSEDLVSSEIAIRRALLATFMINVLGSLLLGVLIAQRDLMRTNQFLAVGTGFAGGLTTFSTFAVAVAEKLDSGEFVMALTNGAGTAFAAVLAAGLGYRLGVISR
jgi:CrcB protein